jgi:murein DD-endopeptidase MepM/ murein hydrolase activator NlpD
MLKMRKMVLGLFVLLLLPSTLLAQEATARFEKVANRMVKAINDANWPGVQADFGQVMLDAFPLEKLTPFFQGLVAQYGKIEKLDAGRYTPPNQAVFPAHFERGILDIKVVLDDQDKIIGLWFLPHTPDIPKVEKHQTELSLPFKGEWLVFWGGDTKELNQHHDFPNQRFAFDFLGLDENGKTRKGDGKANEDYFAFGRGVIAPADGVVTDVIDGVRDNVPGSMNPYSALGNAVFIQHRENEISVLAHLKLDSIKVKVGDKVARGQLIGLCGNSGNSSEPHLHYHLQNTPIIQDGTGIKCLFRKVSVIVNGQEQVKTNYSPIKGDVIVAD